MKRGLTRLFTILVLMIHSVEIYAKARTTSHSFGEKFFTALAGIVFLIGLGVFFFSEINRKNGGYGSGLESYKAGQSRYGCFMFIMAPIMLLLFFLSKGCS